jgi:hypothetical protein
MRPRQPVAEAALGGIIARAKGNGPLGVFRCRDRVRGDRAAPAPLKGRNRLSVSRGTKERKTTRADTLKAG